MKKLILIPLLSIIFSNAFAQVECNPEPKERKEFREGPIELKIRIDSIHIGKTRKIGLKDTRVIYIHNQTNIIQFGDTMGIKFYHVQAIENEHVIHLLRYDIFLLSKDGCWEKEHDNSYSELGYYQHSGNGSVSVGSPNDRDYFKIQWHYGIHKPKDGE